MGDGGGAIWGVGKSTHTHFWMVWIVAFYDTGDGAIIHPFLSASADSWNLVLQHPLVGRASLGTRPMAVDRWVLGLLHCLKYACTLEWCRHARSDVLHQTTTKRTDREAGRKGKKGAGFPLNTAEAPT